jgi:hypothetical protein
MRSVSLCKRFNFPIRFTQGFSPDWVSAASLSLTASVTNSRNEILRAAATYLARRSTESGISSVVLIVPCSDIYGSGSTRPQNLSEN